MRSLLKIACASSDTLDVAPEALLLCLEDPASIQYPLGVLPPAGVGSGETAAKGATLMGSGVGGIGSSKSTRT